MLSLSTHQTQSNSEHPTVYRRIARWIRWRLPTKITAHRILSGPLRGKKIVTSWRDYPAAIAGITEPELLGWFESNARTGETWLDIGAHYGYTALALAKLVGPSGRVFAFEPMAATVGCLARTRYLNHLESITIVPLALGLVDSLEVQKLSTVRGMVDSTLGATSSNAPGASWSEMIMVAQMDWLWPKISGNDARIHGVKIDVQGMELHVLRGMVETLKEHRPKLVIELHRGVDRDEVLQLLGSVGYSPVAVPIEPVFGETTAQFMDDRSYAFTSSNATR